MKFRSPGALLWLTSTLALAMTTPLAMAVPTGNPDTYPAREDRPLIVPAATGVLGNDTGAGALSAVLESGVTNGSLALNGDGSFTYTPRADFNGTDSFTYRVVESPGGGQVFTVDQGRSSARINATVRTTFGNASDNDTTALKGTLTATVTPPASPFSQIHVTDLNVTTAEAVALNFRWFLGIAGVDVNAAPEGLTIEMVTPGAPAAVDAAGAFNQTNNEVRLVGDANINATGLADGLIPEGAQTFDSPGNFIDLPGTLTQSGSTLTLASPVAFVGTFDLDGNAVDITMNGNVVATSTVQTPQSSAPVTVTINITPANDPPLVADEHYLATANSLLAVPVTLAGGGDQLLVDTGATWRFLDDGSDQGNAWKAPGFDDAAWASGPGQLGYGDTEATTVSFGGDANNKHVTTYFRHQFSLPDPEAHGNLTLRLKRDDGAAVYLNGTEIARSNLAPAAAASTLAASTVDAAAESHYYEFAVPASLLTAGTNTLAAEVHQGSAASSDLVFDLQLLRHRTAGGVLANDTDIDGDTLTASVHAQPSHGTLTLAANGSFTYTPDPGFVGTDAFIYAVQDVDDYVEYALIPFADRWSFLDDGSDQGTAWLAPGFDDSAWATGTGEFGYGETDQSTTVGFGPDPNNKFATTYFRNRFFVGNLAALSDDVSFQLVRDDAAAVYINGTEVYRDANLIGGALFNTFANPGVIDEDATVSVGVPKAVLVEGENAIAVEVHQSGGTSSDLAFHLALSIETPAKGPILPAGAAWNFLAGSTDLGSAWRGTSFDDSLWLSGASELGYGDGDEATALPVPADPKPITVYFRRTLHIPDASQVQTLEVELVRDDGAAIYLNGVEIVRDNLPAGAAFDTLASSTANGESESRFRPFVKIDPKLLRDGDNTIAAEVHQASETSSDLSFNLRVNASLVASLGIATIEVIGTPSADTDNDGMDDSWEIANGLTVGTDDSGLDHDGDGRTSIEEFLALTDPRDPLSLLKITAVTRAGNGRVTVNFSSTPGKTYQLQHSPDLASPFADVAGAQLTASAPRSSLDATLPSPTAGYLRILVR